MPLAFIEAAQNAQQAAGGRQVKYLTSIGGGASERRKLLEGQTQQHYVLFFGTEVREAEHFAGQAGQRD